MIWRAELLAGPRAAWLPRGPTRWLSSLLTISGERGHSLPGVCAKHGSASVALPRQTVLSVPARWLLSLSSFGFGLLLCSLLLLGTQVLCFLANCQWFQLWTFSASVALVVEDSMGFSEADFPVRTTRELVATLLTAPHLREHDCCPSAHVMWAQGSTDYCYIISCL